MRGFEAYSEDMWLEAVIKEKVGMHVIKNIYSTRTSEAASPRCLGESVPADLLIKLHNGVLKGNDGFFLFPPQFGHLPTPTHQPALPFVYYIMATN